MRFYHVLLNMCIHTYESKHHVRHLICYSLAYGQNLVFLKTYKELEVEIGGQVEKLCTLLGYNVNMIKL
jgi:hypothetical protein